ncbi:FG-GAP-like repeat-containing protein [Flavipsychrobacter stenotrophus]|nr:FG-GAP-like repeat-containing protein [Flavipsychrobacter stenotrophus]
MKKTLLPLVFLLLVWANVGAQVTWSSPSGLAYNSGGNWTGGSVPNSTAWAQFSTVGTGTAVTLTGGAQAVGAIEVTATRTANLNITPSATASLTLNGATVSGTSDVILSNASTTIVFGFPASTLAIPISGVTNKNIITGGGSTSLVTGGTISIGGILSGTAPLTFLGGGTWDGSAGNLGGLLRLGGANTINGGITVGSSSTITNSGMLELTSITSIANGASNTITVNPFSSLYLSSAAGTYAISSVDVVLNSLGNNSTYTGGGTLIASGVAHTLSSPINLASTSVGISILTSGTLTLSGNIRGVGQMVKISPGTLILAGSTNTWTGGTKIVDGKINVLSTSALSSGDLTFAPITLVSPTISLNNTVNSVGSLSSSFGVSAGTAANTLFIASGATLTVNQTSNGSYGTGAVNTLTSAISGTGAILAKKGTATLTFTGTSVTLSGLRIDAGEVRLNPGASITSGNTVTLLTIPASITLNGGNITTTGITTAATITLGTLMLNENSTLDLGTASVHTIRFATGSPTWTATKKLLITNWGNGRIFFGTTSGGLTTQVSAIFFVSPNGGQVPAQILSTGEITPSPVIRKPIITGVSTNIANAGSSTLTITGTGFDATSANHVVYFGATKATISSGSTTTLLVTVPLGAIYAPLSVLNAADTLTGFEQYAFLPKFDTAGYIHDVVSLSDKIDFSTGSSPFYTAIGDLDGDGKSDLVVVNKVSNTVSLYRNTSSSGSITAGSFDAKVDFATGATPYSVAIGDLDGDGKPEIAVANYFGNSVSVYRNTTTSGAFTSGSFAAKVDYTAATNPYGIVIADIDGDGKSDIAVSNTGSNSISVFRNMSFKNVSFTSASFAAKQDFTTGASPQGIAVGDLDGDTKPDLAVANSGATTISLFRNTATAGFINISTFATATTATTTTTPTGLVIGDLNNDNKADIAVTNRGLGTVSLFRNNSTVGTITMIAKIDVTIGTGTTPNALAIGDLDGDGKPDIAVANTGTSTVTVMRNTATDAAAFSATTSFSKTDFTPAANPIAIAIGDLDNDGKADMVATDTLTGAISVFRNDPSTAISISGISPNEGIPGATVTITGVGFSNSSSNMLVRFGTMLGTVTGASTTLISVTIPYGATPGPVSVLNKASHLTAYTDSLFRLKFTNSYFDPNTVNFKPYVSYVCVSGALTPYGGAIGDIDGDLKPDLLVNNVDNPSYTALLNSSTAQGSLTTSSFSGTAQGLGSTFKANNAKLADLDGDGKLDGVITNSHTSGTTLAILRNTSTLGAPTFSTTFISISGFTAVSAIVDFDADGKSDIALSYPGGFIGILRNTSSVGSISFASPVFISAGSAPSGICFADLNNDGKPDIATANSGATGSPGVYNGSSLTYAPNASSPGTISFGTSVSITTGSGPIDIVAADIDRNTDRLPELLVTNINDGSISVFKNISTVGGTIAFDPQFVFTIGSAASGTTGINVADFNGDGKIDVVVSNAYAGTVSVLRNTATAGTINSSTFAAQVDLSSGPAPVTVTTGDVDRDGYPDIVVGNSTTNTVSVIKNYPLPLIGTSSGATSVCVGATITISNTVTGGLWVSSQPAKATVDPVTGVVTGIAAGADTIDYYMVRGFDTSLVRWPITVNPLADVGDITGTSSVCTGNSITLSNTAVGGTWGATNGFATQVNGVVTGVSAGVDTITYSATNVCGTRYDSFVVTVIASPNAGTITGSSSVCTGSAITLTDAAPGGSWSASNGFATVVDGVVTGVSAGVDTISYTVSNSCGTAIATKVVTVNSLPDAGSISGSASVCVGAAITLTDAVPGGSWSASNGLATVVGGVVTGVSTGVDTISYTVTTACGTAVATHVVTVNPLPDAGSITGGSSVCTGAAITLTDAAVGGSWSASNGSATVVGGVVTGVSAGVDTISYTVTNGCGTAVATHIVTVNATPDAGTIMGSSSVCTGMSITLTNAAVGGSWSASNATATVVGGVVTGVIAGTDTISYTVTTACGSASATKVITINGSPDPGTITGDTTSCVGGTITLTDLVIGGTWSSSNTSVATVASGVVTGLSTGSAVISYTVTTACGSAYATHSVSFGAMQWTGAISSDWNTAANWGCGAVPTVTDDVTIPSSATYPAIAASATGSARKVTLVSGASISLGAVAQLNIKGDLTNNGAITGPGKLSLNGSSAQLVKGLGTVNEVEIDNASGVSIDTASRMTVRSTLYITSGTLATNDSLALYSDSNSSARIAEIASGTPITGKVKVYQYIQGGLRRFRFWAHPFSTSISLGQLQPYMDITGQGGATNGFTTTGTNAPSAFRLDPYTENSLLSYDPGWKAITKINGTEADSNKLKRYQGIRLFMRGKKGQGLGGFSYTPSPNIVAMSGPVNQGTQVVTLSRGATDPTNQDFNMVGNPYPSPVNIGAAIYAGRAVTLGGTGDITGSAFYVYNASLGVAGQFQPVTINSTSYYIQANACVQVRAADDLKQLTFTESMKSDTVNTILFKQQPQEHISLNIYDATYHMWDMLTINFNAAATDAEDAMYDAVKPAFGDLSFYGISTDNRKMAIDARQFVKDKVVPLGITSSYKQDFIIRADDMILPENTSVFLRDKWLNRSTELAAGSEYKFSITGDAKSQGNDRFELGLKSTATVPVKPLAVSMSPNPTTDAVKISFTSGKKEKVAVRVTDISGVSIYTQDLGEQLNGTVSVPLNKFAAGIYLVELTQGDQKVTQRLVKE